MKVIDCIQGSPEWHTARLGKLTASNFDKLVNMDGSASKERVKYLYQLAGEIIMGQSEESYTSAAMQRGRELEAEAVNFYEITEGVTTSEVGFCLSDDETYGASPDRLILDEGGLEVKCPSLATHVSYLVQKKLPSKYYQQVQGNLLVTGRKWWDFLSYYPKMRPLLIRVKPDEQFQNYLKMELKEAHINLQEIVESIR